MSQPISNRGHSFLGKDDTTEFTNWLTEFLAEPQAVFYAQHPLKRGEHGVYIAAELPVEFKLNDWQEGRLFNDWFELRWHLHDDMVNLLLLTEQKDKPTACADLCDWQERDVDYTVISTRHMLVGTFYRRGGDWFFAEAGVPREFRYPLAQNFNPQARAHAILYGKHYRRGSRTVLTRFTHFGIQKQRGGEQL